mgnify:CR=1 FL=1
MKNAIDRLHERSPETKVIFKSANTRAPSGIDRSNWYHEELNSVLLQVFSGLPNVIVIDVWNMTTIHYSGWNIHPYDFVLKEEVAVALSYLCPTEV